MRAVKTSVPAKVSVAASTSSAMMVMVESPLPLKTSVMLIPFVALAKDAVRDNPACCSSVKL